MPCYDSRDDYGVSPGQYASVQRQVNEVETMLCGICRRVEACTLFAEASARTRLIADDPTLATWWKHHKAIDDQKARVATAAEAASKERKRLAKSARAKMTPDEREALGIRD